MMQEYQLPVPGYLQRDYRQHRCSFQILKAIDQTVQLVF